MRSSITKSRLSSAMVLLIDDERTPAMFDIQVDRVARTYSDAMSALRERRWTLILVDHDLADFDGDGQERNGHDVVTWLESNPAYLPLDMVCISKNPSGRRRIEAAIASAYSRAASMGLDLDEPLPIESKML